MYDLARKNHDLCQGAKGSRKRRSVFKVFSFFNVEETGSIFWFFFIFKGNNYFTSA